MTISKNGVAILILVLSLFGIDLGEETAIEFINALGTAVSILLLIYNQVTRTDTKNFFFKK